MDVIFACKNTFYYSYFNVELIDGLFECKNTFQKPAFGIILLFSVNRYKKLRVLKKCNI